MFYKFLVVFGLGLWAGGENKGRGVLIGVCGRVAKNLAKMASRVGG